MKKRLNPYVDYKGINSLPFSEQCKIRSKQRRLDVLMHEPYIQIKDEELKPELSSTKSGKIKLFGVQLSYPSLHEPKVWQDQDADRAKYEASFLIPKKYKNVAVELKSWLQEEWEEETGDSAEGILLAVKPPVKPSKRNPDPSDIQMENYSVKSHSKYQPDCRYPDIRKRVPVERIEALFYPGCYVEAYLSPYTFSHSGNEGVSLNLIAIRFLEDGERIGGDNGLNDDDLEEAKPYKPKSSNKKMQRNSDKRRKAKKIETDDDDLEDDIPF